MHVILPGQAFEGFFFFFLSACFFFWLPQINESKKKNDKKKTQKRKENILNWALGLWLQLLCLTFAWQSLIGTSIHQIIALFKNKVMNCLKNKYSNKSGTMSIQVVTSDNENSDPDAIQEEIIKQKATNPVAVTKTKEKFLNVRKNSITSSMNNSHRYSTSQYSDMDPEMSKSERIATTFAAAPPQSSYELRLNIHSAIELSQNSRSKSPQQPISPNTVITMTTETKTTSPPPSSSESCLLKKANVPGINNHTPKSQHQKLNDILKNKIVLNELCGCCCFIFFFIFFFFCFFFFL